MLPKESAEAVRSDQLKMLAENIDVRDLEMMGVEPR